MFISENNFLGRINTAHQLLVRGIGSASGNYLKNILRHRRFEMGEFNLSLVALWAMFGSKASLGLEPMFLQLLSTSRARVKSSLMVKEDLRSSVIRFGISKIVKGQDFKVSISKSMSLI